MASSRDAQDILDLKQTEPTGRPKKKGNKPKLVRPAHIPKEVWLLETQGDRAPPIALTAIQPKKPKFTRRVRPYEWQAFNHPNRTDGLVLRHWGKKSIAASAQANGGPATPADGTTAAIPDDKEAQAAPTVPTHWAKYNVKVDVPQYTLEEYAKHLKASDWSKEETDYLISIVQDFDLRWVVIADRYDYSAAAEAELNGSDSMAVVPVAKQRSMEDLKARYYKVASAMMAVKQPLSSMTQAEFSLHEKMTKFDSVKETRRKRMAEQLLERTDQEIEEEKRLLAELKRIVQEEDDFIAERQELYERLAAPSSRGNTSMYESSAGLVQLGQQLAAQDRSRSRQYQLQQQQRRQIAGLDDKDKSNSPAAPPIGGLQRGSSDMRRSLDGTAAGRKDGKSGQHTFMQRNLTAADERKYGVQRPEKLLTGEKIRHVRIERRVTARANSVAIKVQDTMVELGIPVKPVMATQRITEGYEQLCFQLDTLLESRRAIDRVENEIKVLRAQKEARENKTEDGDAAGAAESKAEDATQNDTQDSTQEVEGDSKAEAADEDEKNDVREEDEEEDDDDAVDDQEEEEQDEEEEEEEEEEAEEEEAEEEDEDEDAGHPESDEEGDEVREVEDEEPGDDASEPDVDEEATEVEEEEEESRPSTRASRKRSVSVLSSTQSQKGTKRQRK